MFIFKEIIVFLCVTYPVRSERTFNICPRFCNCDSYLELNRARCSSKRLVSAEVDLPNQVQILDLSYNDITVVDKKCFESFTFLKYLNLSHNALHTLDWQAFSRLRRLTEIDLSYNRLEILDERLFLRNKYLLKINLEGNKLESLQRKALLNNAFVTELNLQNSQLYLLQPALFAGLPNLRHLDLSKNMLNNFVLEDFGQLKKLEFLNLNENNFKCDSNLQNKLKSLQTRGIKVMLDKCSSQISGNFQQNIKLFEKMVVLPPQEKNLGEDEDDIQNWRLNLELKDNSYEDFSENDDDINNEWSSFAPETVLCDPKNTDLCGEYRSCLQDLNKAWHEQHKRKEQCPSHDIKLAFFIGIATGVSSIVLLLACALCSKKCFETKKSDPDNIEDMCTQPMTRPSTQLPPQIRRTTRRRAALPPRSLVRYEGPVRENFLSRLFGRPARLEYYRTINQNTATLIRRLSRSNLLNNRLSQHLLDRQTSVEPNSTASAPRVETPPPSYGDVFVNNISDDK